MKVKKLGNIDLTFPLWWTNYNDVVTIQSETEQTITGGVIVWEQTRDITGLNIILESLNDGWQDIATKDAIKTLITTSLGSQTTITLEDDTIVNVRFRHENSEGAVDFERVVNASLSEYYECTLHLAKV